MCFNFQCAEFLSHVSRIRKTRQVRVVARQDIVPLTDPATTPVDLAAADDEEVILLDVAVPDHGAELLQTRPSAWGDSFDGDDSATDAHVAPESVGVIEALVYEEDIQTDEYFDADCEFLFATQFHDLQTDFWSSPFILVEDHVEVSLPEIGRSPQKFNAKALAEAWAVQLLADDS